MKQFIIIYELIPDAISVYRLETDDPVLIAKAEAMHRQFVNSTDMSDEVANTINDIMTELPGIECILDDTDAESTLPLMVAGDCIIILTGIVL